jgi:hypothetical protein
VDVPPLPPVPAGRSALPAFLPVEAWARERTAAARAAATGRIADAVAEAERITREGETALKEAVTAGEAEAVRDVEDRARDRISAARRALNDWVDRSEQAVGKILDDAVDRLCGD